MGRNTNKGYRRGVVKERSQLYNEKTKKYVKRDKVTGRFLSASDKPYKNIRREQSIRNGVAKSSK